MGKMEPSARRSRQGFTLTELLVATAIFLILMSALTALFNSAIHSVRQGYASISVFEQGRTAMSVMSRDLTSAFTAREFGDVYNFYGRHDGFMFVGALDGGQLGRVTYAFHPDPDFIPEKETTITLAWEVMEESVRRQVARHARELGLAAGAVKAAQDDVVARIGLAYAMPALPGDFVEFQVEVETGSLIRYEEPIANLDTFDMRITSDGAVNLVWPYVDPVDPSQDAVPLDADGDTQLRFLRGAISPDPSVNSASDLRNLYTDINIASNGWPHPVTNDRIYLRVLGPEFFQTVFRCRKRDFWIQMLSGDPDLPDFWHDEREGAQPGPSERRILNEYIVADGIVEGAYLIDPATGDRILMVPADPTTGVDILDADVKFHYGDGVNTPLYTYNSYQNLRDPRNMDGLDPLVPGEPIDSIPVLVGRARNSGSAIDRADVVEADAILADNLLGIRSSWANMGSPLAPRIPAVVIPEFWVTRSKRHPNSPDIVKHFSQTIQLPAASGRDVPATIALSPGATL